MERLPITNVALVGLLLVLILFYLSLKWRRRQRERILKQINTKKYKRNYLLPFTILFSQTRLFRKSFEKIRNRVKLIYPADIVEINVKVTKDMLSSLGLAALVIFGFIATAGTDLFYICFGVVMGYVFYTNRINLQYEKADSKLLEQFYIFLKLFRHNYYMSGKKIDDAIYMSIDESPFEISLHMQRIYQMLISIDMQKEVDKYVLVAPNRFILSFVAMASSVMEYGDKELEDGSSMVLTNVDSIKDEVHDEMDHIKKNQLLFAGRIAISLFPILGIKPVQWYAFHFMPEIKDFYTSTMGITFEVILFLLCLVSYAAIMNLKDRRIKELKEYRILFKLSKIPFINAILTKEANRNFSKTQKLNDKLKLTGEQMGFKQFLLRRILIAIAFFAGFQFLILVSQWQEKQNILSDYTTSFSSTYVGDAELEAEMRRVAAKYMNNKKLYENGLGDPDTIKEDIVATTAIKKPYLAEMIVEELTNKVNTYNDIYYQWYFLLGSIGLMYIGFMIPMWMLNGKIKSIKMGMEDEVNQFQTIVMLLMHVDGMSIQVVLEWIERFSYCFQESIQTCINDLPYDEQVALKNLRNSESFEYFKQFVNNLLIVNDQGLVAAFEEIVSERKHNLENRKTNRMIIRQNKARKATYICIVPLAFLIVVYIIYPLGIFATNMWSSMIM